MPKEFGICEKEQNCQDKPGNDLFNNQPEGALPCIHFLLFSSFAVATRYRKIRTLIKGGMQIRHPIKSILDKKIVKNVRATGFAVMAEVICLTV